MGIGEVAMVVSLGIQTWSSVGVAAVAVAAAAGAMGCDMVASDKCP